MAATDQAAPFELAAAAATALAERTGVDRHDAVVVLGSGWGPAAERLGSVVVEVAMTDLPGFPAPSVAGHRGTITSTDLDGHRLLVLQGRSHLYEDHPPHVVVHGVRTAILAGCRLVLLTNAAGGVDPDLVVGGPVLVRDHLNLTGRNPLVGPPPPEGLGPRFVDLTDAYAPRLRAIARQLRPELREGVYACFLGPAYETPAEVHMARTLGADLVGMSTAYETMAARQLGAEVLALSLVTNAAAGVVAEPIDHADVLARGRAAAADLGALLADITRRALS